MSWVTEEEEALIRKFYSDRSVANDEIASDLDMSVGEFLEACEAIGLKRRKDPPIYKPSPADIRVACAEIRLNWSNADREERLRAAWPEW